MKKFYKKALINLHKTKISEEAKDYDKNQFSETSNQSDVEQLSKQQIGGKEFHFVI